METDINNIKKDIRKEIADKKSQMNQEDVQAKSKAIMLKLKSTEMFSKAANIFSYLNYNNEVVTTELLAEILDEKNVFVPKMFGKRNMRFLRLKSLENGLKKNKFGILEPELDDINAYEPEYLEREFQKNTLVIMPGLSFDLKMNRLGYGGGFYDTFLEKNPLVKKVAVCFESQIYDGILPTEKTDICMDIIITEKNIYFMEEKWKN